MNSLYYRTDNQQYPHFSTIGGVRKIKDFNIPCNHPGHNPPNYMVFSPGIYENKCPGCGKITIFTVQPIWY